jgi:hypothetical protein
MEAIRASAPTEGRALRPGAVTLLDLDGETLIAGLRRRGVIADSPRVGEAG